MANDDLHSVTGIFLVSSNHTLDVDANRASPALSSSNRSFSVNFKRTLRNSLSSASFRRYRSPFHRSTMNTASVNPQCSPSPSFPLFRRFYLSRNAFKRRRTRGVPDGITDSYTISTPEKIYSSLKIETRHVMTTILITIVSACLLISMIFLDLAYLDDAFIASTNDEIIQSYGKNTTLVCFRHPKVCVMKGLVVFVFVTITITLSYTILALYTRARSHSRILERKTDELEKEKCLTEKLLHEILPPCVAKDLINGRKAPAEYYESVTVYFSDIVGFTIIARLNFFFEQIV